MPLPGLIAAELRRWIGQRTGLLFPDANGGYVRYSNWRRRRLDTAASLAIQAGASVVSVSRMLGHEDPSTTLKHYAGLFPSDLIEVSNGLDRAAKRAIRMPQQGLAAIPVPTIYRPNSAEAPKLGPKVEQSLG